MKLRTHFTALIVALTLLFFAPALKAQTTWYVDDDAPGDPGPGDTSISDPLEDGTADHPFDAIQEGIDAAVNGDMVLVADGTYTGTGNRDMSFLGKAITVRSENGPRNCIVDCEGTETQNRWGFEFVLGEGPDAVLDGLTITRSSGFRYSPPTHGCAVYADGASPTITGNVITLGTGTYLGRGGGVWAYWSDMRVIGNTISNNTNEGGAGLWSGAGNPLIEGNTITGNVSSSGVGSPGSGGGISLYFIGAAQVTGNLISGNEGTLGGGLYIYETPGGGVNAPLVENNIILNNYATGSGGGVYLNGAEPVSFTNNLIAGNNASSIGDGVYCIRLDTENGVTSFRNCTIAGNGYSGLTLYGYEAGDLSTLALVDCILADNGSGSTERNLSMGGIANTITVFLDHCLIKDAQETVHVGSQALIQTTPVITDDPLFATGPGGGYYLSQVAAGQDADSPALDAGSDQAASICTAGGSETICLDELTTRRDLVADSGVVDLGYHRTTELNTVTALLLASPVEGVLPFSSRFTVALTNNYFGLARRLQYQVDITLAGGQYYPSWRNGWQNVQPGETFSRNWWQTIPAMGTLVGVNDFRLTARDVTPSPWNQPPYPPAGDTDTASCTVTGVAP